MSMTRRRALGGLTGIAAPALVRAQEVWPSRLVSIIVPYNPGGYLDVVSRVVADGLSARTRQTFLVLNRPGGNGQVGLGDLTRAAPDGYTLLVNNDGGLAAQPVFDRNFHYDPARDYTPLAQIVASTYLLSMRSSLPATNLRELIAYAKTAPKPLTFASPGIGTTPHVGMEYFARKAGIELIHVPYSGGTGPVNDLAAGHVDLYMASIATIVGVGNSDRIRIIATMAPTRSPRLPDVPTMAEAGLPGFAVAGWLGLFGPPGMPPPLRERISGAFADIVRDPAMAAKLDKLNAEPIAMNVAEFEPFYRAEIAHWRAFAAETGLSFGD